MPARKRTCVYQIIEKETNICCYVGSSFSYIDRKAQHKYDSINGSSCPIHEYIRQKGGIHLFEFKVLEYCEEISKTELHLKEKQYINQLKPVYNKLNPLKTHQLS